MKKYFFIWMMVIHCSTILFAQQINEAKVNKAAAIMQKMIANPDQMMALYQEMQALQLTPAEEQEASKRAQKQAMNEAAGIKDQALDMGGKTEQQIKESRAQSKQLLPLKNEQRLNAVVKRTLTDNELKLYCKAVHDRVTAIMYPQAVAQAEDMYKKLASNSKFAQDMGNGAVLLYLSNLTQQSLYIMGRVCSETQADANTLNNYAALLNHFNLQEAAIPILNRLRSKYGASAPVMNNLTLAWFGLGDLKTAGKYADTVIQRFPGRRGHAHYVKSVIKDGEGDKKGAVEEMKKSIDESYSQEKESILSKWNGSMKSSDFKLKQVSDLMGLEEFTVPAFPMSYEEYLQLKDIWIEYHTKLDAALSDAEQRYYELRAIADQKQVQLVLHTSKNQSAGYAAALNNNLNLAMQTYSGVINEEYAEVERELIEKQNQIDEKIKVFRQQLDREMEDMMRKYKGKCGEGQDCPEMEICNDQKKVYDAFLKRANGASQKYFDSVLTVRRYYINQIVHASMYSSDEIYFPVEQAMHQMYFIAFMKSINYQKPGGLFTGDGHIKCIDFGKSNPFQKGVLPDFDDVNCQDNWSMVFPGGSKVSTRCRYIELELDFQAFTFGFKEDMLTGDWSNMTLEVGTDISITEKLGIPTAPAGDEGPKVDVYVGGAGFIEIEKSGVQDWGVKDVGVKVKAGASAGPKLIEGEKKISIMSGKPDFGTKGEFKSDFGILTLPFKK